MLTPAHLRDLLVDPAAHPRGQPHLSATSGLVPAGRWLYVVADDEHHLGMFDAAAGNDAALLLYRILPGDLPHDMEERKERKPDMEALVLLPGAPGHPHDMLVALGSGSKKRRMTAFVGELDSHGAPRGAGRALDLSGWYKPLQEKFGKLNIEGAFVAGQTFHLLKRGNKGDGKNAALLFSLDDVRAWAAGRRDAAPKLRRTVEFDLGDIGGVPLGFTDGAALPGGGWVFSAVAEATDDSYNDGPCAGSAIGWVAADGRLQRIEPLAGSPKVEGIALDGSRLLIVTDADDPEIASRLLTLQNS